jgi:secreted PhoX family phosphatase
MPIADASTNDTFDAVLRRHVSRRRLLTGAAAVAGMVAINGSGLVRPTRVAAAPEPGSHLSFTPIALTDVDAVTVAPGYETDVLIRWGDPLLSRAPAFNINTFTAAQQKESFGYNNDYVGYYPLRGNAGLLVVNHEYTNPELMFYGYDANNPTQVQVDVELEAHGLTVVEVRSLRGGKKWEYVVGAVQNRRITATTPMMLTGPAAGDVLLQTTADPTLATCWAC